MLRLIQKYISFHIKIIHSSFDKVLCKTDGQLFCLLFNLKSFLRHKPIKFLFDKKSNRYLATSPKRSVHFYHTKQANMCYENGFDARSVDLERDYLLNFIKFKPGDLIVDCGANVGDLRNFFSDKDIAIEYIGIEPSPREFECLRLNIGTSRAVNVGLWDSDGSLDFYVSSQTADSSFIEPKSFDLVKKVPTKRLDSLVNGRIKLLKLEAEGAEPEVLKGCENILNEIEWISADLGFERGTEQTSTFCPVTNFLLSRNFELVQVNHQRVVGLFRNKSLNLPQ